MHVRYGVCCPVHRDVGDVNPLVVHIGAHGATKCLDVVAVRGGLLHWATFAMFIFDLKLSL